MRYRSTSGKAPLTSLRGAVLRGLAPDGGLYMPAEIARHTGVELEEFRRLPFTEVCFRVVKPFATPDVPEEVLWQVVAEAINFQAADAGQVATAGDFVLTASEVNPVLSELRTHGIAVTALHSHMLTEQPRLLFMHFWAVGDPQSVGTGIKAALGHIAVK